MQLQHEDVTTEERGAVARDARLRAGGIRPARSRAAWTDIHPVRAGGALRRLVARSVARLLARGG
jgi:hypothetical protein